MNSDNKIVHALWIGDTLSAIELLCIHSFMAMGHEFHLWLYEPLKTTLPAGLITEDASSIIPANSVFSYRNKNQFGHGKGSYAGFSDIFRYKLLYEKGGWWVDMDVVCLKPLDFSEPYVFRAHHKMNVVGNIMKCPKNAEIMINCYQHALKEITFDNKNWNIPMYILNEQINKFKLNEYIYDFTNKDSWHAIVGLIFTDNRKTKSFYAVHLMNEEWRSNEIDKNSLPACGFVSKQLSKYNLYTHSGFFKKLTNAMRILIPSNIFLLVLGFIKGNNSFK